MRDFIKMIVVLFVSCALAAGSLAVVNAITKEPIANLEKVQKDEAFRKVLPAAADEFVEVAPGTVWDALSKKEKVGRVYITEVQGYAGPVGLAIGTDLNGAVTGLEILVQTETPGLGAKCKEPAFRDQFKGKLPPQIILKKDDPVNGQIDAITGATITSRAVTNGVREAVSAGAGKIAAVPPVVAPPPAVPTPPADPREAAFRAVLPRAEKFAPLPGGKAWEAFRGAEKIGRVFLGEAEGYGGPISVAFGTTLSGDITGLQILGQTETEGVGSQVAGRQFTGQFRHKRMEQIALKVDDPKNGKIDAITGATISSGAVTKAVRSALEAFYKENPGEAK